MRLGYENISEDVEFRDFLRAQLAEPELTLERLPMDTMTKVYRLHLPGRASLFCKRGIINPKMTEFLRNLPDDSIMIPILHRNFPDFKGETVLAFKWCDLHHVHISEMSNSQFELFIDGSRRLYDILKGTIIAQAPFDADKWMETVCENCRGKSLMSMLFRSILRMHPVDYRYSTETTGLTVTHGDFHTENFGFDAEGQLKFLDFDLMVRALPTEDYTHLVCGAMRHGRILFDPILKRRIIGRYRCLIDRLPYSFADWRIALNRVRLRRAAELLLGKGGSLRTAREFLRRDLPVRCLYGVLERLERSRFRPEVLRQTLERALGFRLVSLKPLKSVNALNFKATRADGFVFTVKCIPKICRLAYERTVLHLRQMKGARVPQRLFEETCPVEFRGHYILCLSWCEGVGLPPQDLDEEDYRRFMDDYMDFSRRLRQTSLLIPVYPTADWRKMVLTSCRGISGRLLRMLVNELEEDLSFYRCEKVRVIHGDMHPGNLTFQNGRVTGFLDVESFTEGYPAWDFVRYFVFALEHVGWYCPWRRQKIFGRFESTVGYLPYARDEWIVSVNASWLERLEKKLSARPPGILTVLRLLWVARTYRRLRNIARTCRCRSA